MRMCVWLASLAHQRTRIIIMIVSILAMNTHMSGSDDDANLMHDLFSSTATVAIANSVSGYRNIFILNTLLKHLVQNRNIIVMLDEKSSIRWH